MPPSFVETMRGWLKSGEGEHPISFQVHAAGTGGGRFELTGVIHAPPLAVERPARGELEISARKRSISYRLSFLGEDGRAYSLSAVKHVSLRAPVRSMTRMATVIHDAEGRPVAEGEMRFDLRDLGAFARSWLPVVGDERRRLDARRRQLDRQLLAGR